MTNVVPIRRGDPPAGDGIAHLLSQTWPSNRKRGDFRDLLRAQADLEPRRVICGHCEKQSPLVDGPAGRAWWASHKTKCRRMAAA